jgi:hypothetical protein
MLEKINSYSMPYVVNIWTLHILLTYDVLIESLSATALDPQLAHRLHGIYLTSNLPRKIGIALACPISCTNLRPVGRQCDTQPPTPNRLITGNVPPPLEPYPNMSPSSAHKGRNVTAQKKHTFCHVAMETRLLVSEWFNVFHNNPLQPCGYYMYHLV